MIKAGFFPLFLVFFLCSSSFIFGWLSAVYIVPGDLKRSQNLPYGKQQALLEKGLTAEDFQSNSQSKIPFFEEMKNNILLLFDPYEMDLALKEGTHLKHKTGYLQSPLPGKWKKGSETTKKKEATPGYSPPHFLGREKLSSLQEEAFKGKGGVEFPSHLKEKQDRYDQKNKEQLTAILENQNIFTKQGQFSFLVNVFSEEEEALEYVKKMKRDYPLWSFLIKVKSDHIRIYLGPIASKEKALKFKNTLPQPLPFSLDFLEKMPL